MVSLEWVTQDTHSVGRNVGTGATERGSSPATSLRSQMIWGNLSDFLVLQLLYQENRGNSSSYAAELS